MSLKKSQCSEKIDVSDDVSLLNWAWFTWCSVYSDSDTVNLEWSWRKVHITDMSMKLSCSHLASEISCIFSLTVKSALIDALFSSAWSKTDGTVLRVRDSNWIDKRDIVQQ